MKNVMVVWFALAGVVGFCHAMDYSDDYVRQLIEEKNWEDIVHQVSQGRITPQQLSSHGQLNLNLLDTNGRPLVYHLVRALYQNYTSMGVSQTLMNKPNWRSYHNKVKIKANQSAARHLLAAIVHLLKLHSLDIKYWFITPEDDEATQISYSALYQMIVE